MIAALAGCGGDNAGTGGTGEPAEVVPEPAEDLGRDILHTALAVDLEARTATATIDLAPSAGTGASFEAAGLQIESVTRAEGEGPLKWALSQGRLDVGVPVKTDGPSRVVVSYQFTEQGLFEGLMSNGSTLTWPHHCGNLFPCHSDPADGTTFDLSITGTPAAATTIHPSTISPSAPAYQLAWATGAYSTLDVGTTTGGTHITAYYLPGEEESAKKGTAPLRDMMDFYELTYGPYPFGKEAGVVEVDWGVNGGMEHHPLWHVSTLAMSDPWTHAHEAAHGWFGGGVRIGCWADLVLSEGTVSYLEARAVAQVMGAEEGQKVWTFYQIRLNSAMASASPKIAWPEGCAEVDLEDSKYREIVYMKGAHFFRALEGKIGANMVDTALKAFFLKYRGKAARFSDLLDVTKSVVGYDATACAESWLRSEAVPAEAACP